MVDRHAMLQQVDIRVTQSIVAGYLEGDVHQSNLPLCWPLRIPRIRMLGEVKSVEVVAKRGEHAAMFRILLGDLKAKHLGIETLRALLVSHTQVHMPNL